MRSRAKPRARARVGRTRARRASVPGGRLGLALGIFLGLTLGTLLPACEDAPPALAAATDLARLDGVAVGEVALDAGPDGIVAVTDLAEPPPRHGIVCGAALCVVEANQYCHTSDRGSSGFCVARPSASPGYYGCDGPEDCATGACCLLGAASACSALGFCVSAQILGEFMCHGDLECGPGSRCCPLGASDSPGEYRSCVDGLSPLEPCPPRL